jgi:hypothetical protein
MKRTLNLSLILLLAACATRGPAPEKAPEGSPEALMDMLGGGRPKPRPNPDELAKHPLGSQQNPVRVGGPAGERAYLARLRCQDGRFPEFERTGSFGIGPWGYILDGYSVKCASGQEAMVFMDMYHSTHREDRAVPGFTIEPAPN